MDSNQVFQLALGINSPWFLKDIKLDGKLSKLDIRVDFTPGSKFPCISCGEEYTAYDTKDKTWQHLNFFNYCCYLTARVPRVKCTKCNKIHQVKLPFAREGSGFSLYLEGMILQMAKIMTVSEIAKLFKIGDDRVWLVINHYIPELLDKEDWSRVRNIGIDETSRKKCHNYVTTITDLDKSKVIYVTEGKDATAVYRFKDELEKRGLKAEQIKYICSDLSPAFINGIKNNFPTAQHVFDKFHVVKIVNKAVDEVRAKESRSNDLIRKCKYSLLKNPANLTANQKVKLDSILAEYTQSGEAYKFKLEFQDLFKLPTRIEAELYLKGWISSVQDSKIPHMKKLAKSIKRHSDGILNWFDNKISNGKVEALNCGIQNLKRRAKGFRTLHNFTSLIYLTMGKLSF